MNFCNRLECLYLASFSSLVYKHSSLVRKFVNYGQKQFYNIGPREWCYKTFYGRKGGPLKGPGRTHKYQSRLGELARDKHSRFLRKSIINDRKKFYIIYTSGQFHKTFFRRILSHYRGIALSFDSGVNRIKLFWHKFTHDFL